MLREPATGWHNKFLSTLSLRRATSARPETRRYDVVSIHALLAESDGPTGRPAGVIILFLSTLSLRRATRTFASLFCGCSGFYPRSPCGERQTQGRQTYHQYQFLSTLSLRRATVRYDNYNLHCTVSIHALLAESDNANLGRHRGDNGFYPRSPCGERRVHYDNYNLHCVVSIHALLAESDMRGEHHANNQQEFLSTLSLRRATSGFSNKILELFQVSIHALLAESDPDRAACCCELSRFLSTLSLRRATPWLAGLSRMPHCFYPRSPCGERRRIIFSLQFLQKFLSTLSLRRATIHPQ